MKKYCIFMLIVLFSVISPQGAEALSCVQPPEKMLDRADVIFLGTVEQVTQSVPVDDGVDYFAQRPGGTATFKVARYWKGDYGNTVTLGGIYAWGIQGPFFKEGQSYIVFARETRVGSATSLTAAIDCNSTALADTEFISALDSEVVAVRPPVVPSPVVQFSRNLTLGIEGSDVASLQNILISKGLLVIPPGVSKGYFGPLTRAALAQFQLHAGIVPPVGYFGPITRAYIASTF